MEMESSRRSLDRSKEPGLLKKPRLAAPGERDTHGVLGPKATAPDRDRPFLSRGGPAGSGTPDPTAAATFRSNERERELRGEDQLPTAYRGASYQQQQRQQQMQELAAQYKTALAELTFNSKPIITNLTIIAGEYLHAAKAIAAIVCANILEVPSEQKLPSLYLLDSIVKNIGRDYVKYFAARLPEVFCKAYKQVDSSIHPGMRHLFGTWKGVFLPAPLLIIEKELGFPPIINGSSSGGGSRPDSQVQRPPHSIHVNPKYLEARQQLQQPSRKIQQNQRELSNEPVPEKNPGPGYGDQEFVSDYSRHSDSGIPRTSRRFTEQEISDKPQCNVGKDAHEAVLDQRSGSNANHASGNYRYGQTTTQPSSSKLNMMNKSGLLTSQNWKNSEEEEYVWDDMNCRLMDPGSSNTSSWNPDDSEKPISMQRAERIAPEIEHLESKWNKLESSGKEDRLPSFREADECLPTAHVQHDSGRSDRELSVDSLLTGGSALGYQTPGIWSSHKMKGSLGGVEHLNARISSQQESYPILGSDELSTSMDLSFPKMGVHLMGPSGAAAVSSNFGSLVNTVSASSGMINKQHQQPLRPPSPSPAADADASSSLPQAWKTQVTLKDHPSQVIPDSVPIDFQNDIGWPDTLPQLKQSLSKISQNIKTSSVSLSPQLQHHLPFLQQPDSDPSMQQLQRQSHPSVQSQEPLHSPLSSGSTQPNGSSGTSNSINTGVDVLDQSSTNKLLVAIMKSGLISSTPASSFESLIIQPPLPSGPPPVQVLSTAASSIPLSSALAIVPHGHTQPPSAHPPIPALPPLPPGPPPSSLVSTSSQVTKTTSTNANPLSSLLSSLVAKGLISSLVSKPSDSTIIETPNQLADQSSILATSSSILFSTTSASSTVSLTSLSNELPRLESSSPKGGVLLNAITADLHGLVGLEFKPEIVREFHSAVINSLYDDLEHKCINCGLRFKIQADIQGHFDWHASKSEVGNFDRVSRKWYTHSSYWVARNAGTLSGSFHTFLDLSVSNLEKCEPMVPADENQCICALCGEPFEDFYSEERDEWMYKGTVYLKLPAKEGSMKNMDKEELQVSIVHAKCMSRNSSHEFDDIMFFPMNCSGRSDKYDVGSRFCRSLDVALLSGRMYCAGFSFKVMASCIYCI